MTQTQCVLPGTVSGRSWHTGRVTAAEAFSPRFSAAWRRFPELLTVGTVFSYSGITVEMLSSVLPVESEWTYGLILSGSPEH